ncbi:MAG: hypothetical protein Q7J09_09115 [Methanocalculus sp.]|uniref:hypothetical protein n=1 Tax=Methanocalculus sp. TaxID=2004547 RepID=UPI002726218B|nr:hypothetical protein [Methanocalculus sp.]MDO9540145.1 hypothetical protein [Methanocalculus sp.]
MGSRKQMTIGITINLDNYENIRFDVTGEVESDEDVSELTGFLDGVLAGIGREDPVTAERVDHYRRRVFGSLHPGEADTGLITSCPVTGDEVMEIKTGHDLSGVDTPEPVFLSPESPLLEEAASSEVREEVIASPEVEVASSEIREEIVASPRIEAAPSVKQAVGLFVCEACGAEVNKVQHDVSHLFMNKTLCKKCMNKN